LALRNNLPVTKALGITANTRPLCSRTYLSQFPAGDIDAIYGAVNTFGGQHRRFATKEITHMICVQPTPQQFKTITETGLGIKIVLPEW
jgi:hypothetical protein